MLYALICEDRDGQEDLRKATRDQHLDYISNHDIRYAGPMLADDETTMIGSIIVIEAENREAAETFAASDPYRIAGLFERVTIRPFRQVVP